MANERQCPGCINCDGPIVVPADEGCNGSGSIILQPINVTKRGKTTLLGCKLGTQPRVLIVDGRSRVEIGRVIRVREDMHGSKWFEALVDDINPNVFLSYV